MSDVTGASRASRASQTASESADGGPLAYFLLYMNAETDFESTACGSQVTEQRGGRGTSQSDGTATLATDVRRALEVGMQPLLIHEREVCAHARLKLTGHQSGSSRNLCRSNGGRKRWGASLLIVS